MSFFSFLNFPSESSDSSNQSSQDESYVSSPPTSPVPVVPDASVNDILDQVVSLRVSSDPPVASSVDASVPLQVVRSTRSTIYLSPGVGKKGTIIKIPNGATHVSFAPRSMKDLQIDEHNREIEREEEREEELDAYHQIGVISSFYLSQYEEPPQSPPHTDEPPLSPCEFFKDTPESSQSSQSYDHSV
jgi:hypothetical protein